MIAGALSHEFDKCIGIEYLDGLFKKSMDLRDIYFEKFPDALREDMFITYGTVPELEFHKDDFLDFDWKDADFVLANSTCFDKELMLKIYEKSKQMKQGSYFLTLTKGFPPENESW